MKYHKLLTLTALGLMATASAHAAVIWTGASDNDLFNDANWDFLGAVNGTTAVDPNSALSEDLTITSATVSGNAGGFGALVLSDGFGVTATDSTITLSGTSGFNGVDDGGGTARTNAPATFSLVNSSLSMQFTSIGSDILVDGTSSVQIRGGGDGINSQVEDTRILLSIGGTLILTSDAELTDQLNDAGTGDIFVDGNRVTIANQATFLSRNSDGNFTAIPEPASTALLGLGGVFFLLRRRK